MLEAFNKGVFDRRLQDAAGLTGEFQLLPTHNTRLKHQMLDTLISPLVDRIEDNQHSALLDIVETLVGAVMDITDRV